MWKHGIMKDLFDAGLRGRLPLFIQGFLQNRQFQVRLGKTLVVIAYSLDIHGMNAFAVHIRGFNV